MNKILIIGLDGGTFDLIRPWAAEGKLPNLARIMERGSYGELQSTFPPMTFPAWTTFMTGKNPGNHGIFDFTERKPGSYEIEFVNAKRRQSKTIWKILSEAGKRVGVVAVPVTYPPEEINGVMICGFDAPGVASEADPTSMYPPELYEELKRSIGGYIISADIMKYMNEGRPAEALPVILKTIERKAATAKYLLQREPWDCFMILFGESDLIGHHYWKYHDPNSPLHDPHESPECAKAVLTVYQTLDRIIGELTGMISEDTVVILMSDHGFGGAGDKVIYLNRWLESIGLLKFRASSEKTSFQSIFSKVLNWAKHWGLKTIPPRIKKELFRRRTHIVNKMESWLRFSAIDWKNTLAYSEETPYYPTIWINLKGREPEGIVEPGEEYEKIRQRVIRLLKAWKDPETQQPVVEEVYTREEVYQGKYVHRAPDLLIKWSLDRGYSYQSRSSYYSKDRAPITRLKPDSPGEPKFFSGRTGSHRDQGILMMVGPMIKRNFPLQGARIIDLPSTILYLLGVPVPDDLEGRVLMEAFQDTYRLKNPIRTRQVGGGGWEKTDVDTYSDEETLEISERLKGMGYIE
ncbi:MAG TPA: alkaline phosphatase family protein [Candidatus Limnocylindrales bacterium]|nr:alkaline phosphatase family protein [Candidatus Limnocylindrales bacterium]